MTDFRKTTEWLQGDKAQHQAAELLRGRRWYVVPSYDYSGKEERAPRLEGLTDAFPIPDLDCARGGERKWVEVKSKTGPSWSYKNDEWQHGINAHLYRSYLEVERITGTPVVLLILEESSAWRCRQQGFCPADCAHPPDTEPGWIVASLALVAKHIRQRDQDRMVKKGRAGPQMVYFPRAIFRPLAVAS